MAKITHSTVKIEVDQYEIGMIRRALEFAIRNDAWALLAQDTAAEKLLKELNGQ